MMIELVSSQKINNIPNKNEFKNAFPDFQMYSIFSNYLKNLYESNEITFDD